LVYPYFLNILNDFIRLSTHNWCAKTNYATVGCNNIWFYHTRIVTLKIELFPLPQFPIPFHRFSMLSLHLFQHQFIRSLSPRLSAVIIYYWKWTLVVVVGWARSIDPTCMQMDWSKCSWRKVLEGVRNRKNLRLNQCIFVEKNNYISISIFLKILRLDFN
jgi:hypothetical protein